MQTGLHAELPSELRRRFRSVDRKLQPELSRKLSWTGELQSSPSFTDIAYQTVDEGRVAKEELSGPEGATARE